MRRVQPPACGLQVPPPLCGRRSRGRSAPSESGGRRWLPQQIPTPYSTVDRGATWRPWSERSARHSQCAVPRRARQGAGERSGHRAASRPCRGSAGRNRAPSRPHGTGPRTGRSGRPWVCRMRRRAEAHRSRARDGAGSNHSCHGCSDHRTVRSRCTRRGIRPPSRPRIRSRLRLSDPSTAGPSCPACSARSHPEAIRRNVPVPVHGCTSGRVRSDLAYGSVPSRNSATEHRGRCGPRCGGRARNRRDEGRGHRHPRLPLNALAVSRTEAGIRGCETSEQDRRHRRNTRPPSEAVYREPTDRTGPRRLGPDRLTCSSPPWYTSPTRR